MLQLLEGSGSEVSKYQSINALKSLKPFKFYARIFEMNDK